MTGGPAPELLEREAALAALDARAGAAERGRGGLLLVSGEAGIGKTALLEHFALRRSGLKLLTGFGEATAAVRPLGVFHDIALALRGALRACLLESPSPWRIHEALLDDLAHLPSMPLIRIEDVQWADQASLDALRYVARRAPGLRLLLVATLRVDDPRAPPVRDTLLDGLPLDDWDELRLERLSAPAVQRLAAADGADGSMLYRLTGGNPLFVRSQLRWGRDSVPDSLARLAQQKLAALDPDSAELVRRLSIHPERIADTALRAMPDVTPTALAACVAQHWLVERNGHWTFAHELLRRAVLDTLAPGVRARLHAALLEQPLTVVQAVYHALHAGDSARLRALAPRAADESMRAGAYREAAEYWRIALRHGDAPARERARWLDRLGWSLVHSGDSEAGLQASLDGRRAWLALGDADGLLHSMSSAMRWPLRVREARELFSERDIEDALALPATPRQTFDRAILAVELARRAARHDDIERVRALAAAVRARVDSLTDPAERAELQWWVGWLRFYFLCEIPGPALDEAIAVGERLGLEHFVSQARSLQVLTAALQFDLEGAERRCAAAIAHCEQRDQSQDLRLLLGMRAFVLMRRGRFEESLELAERGLAGLKPPATGADFLQAIAWTVAARIDPAPRQADLTPALARARQAGHAAPLVSLLTLAVEHRWLVGDDALARTYLHELAALKGRLANERSLPFAETVAWVAAMLGQPLPSTPGTDAKDATPAEAARQWQRRAMPYHAAMELARGNEASRRQAVAMLEALGARGALDRLRRYWAGTGPGTVPRGPLAATRRNPAGLTGREREVLGALTRGLSNAQIAQEFGLSTRTVEHHLSAILAKTGTRTRVEALHWAHRQGLV